ncbi:RNA polymerase sigma factor [Nocardia rhamnosiphila]|uniref:RNA polymerase sigma factor n=1 Tax=Nocardia rhamnosiphila TaxID=426716 RepID=UPI0004C45ACD|nr:sigma-70 family RNA polymerase sigma factor [Nocardia rhamnosiphila]
MGRDSLVTPEGDLADRLRRGDETAFETILDQWSPAMLRLARSFVSTNASAEEVVQDVWVAVIRGIDGFEGRSSLKTWVFRILVNTAKKRGIRERRTIPFGSLVGPDEGPTVEPGRFRAEDDPYPGHWRAGREPHRWSEPESSAERAEVLRVVGESLSELPERSQVLLVLRDIEGYSSEEVCELLDISPGNQRVILHRARAAVRARLEEYFGATGEVRR